MRSSLDGLEGLEGQPKKSRRSQAARPGALNVLGSDGDADTLVQQDAPIVDPAVPNSLTQREGEVDTGDSNSEQVGVLPYTVHLTRLTFLSSL